MSLVCLDNHVLIWGIKEQPTKGQEDMVSRTKAFQPWVLLFAQEE
mgnify:CR=1 FL=1